MDERSFLLNRETAVSYLNSLHHVFVFDGFANWDPEARIKVRQDTADVCLCVHRKMLS
jgi:phosphoenolpyruvate carboxykinase (ATP)